jgi:hypothetical protein
MVVVAASGSGRPPDQVQFGGQRPAWWSGRRGRAVVTVAIAALLAAAGYGLVVRQDGRQRPGAVTVIDVGHRLLGVTGQWELYAQGRAAAIRIQLAAGRVTVTRFPALRSSGPVSFVVGSDWALIRPLDHVPGYVVRAGQPARQLSGPLGPGGLLLMPGPAPGQLWSGTAVASAGPMLVRKLDGTLTGTSGPRTSGSWPVGTGAGSYVLVGPSGVSIPEQRGAAVTTLRVSSVLAIGPASLLAVRCRHFHCAAVLIDQRTGRWRVLPGQAYDEIQPTGLIAPDGRLAAVTRMTGSQYSLELVDLSTGTAHTVLASIGPGGPDQASLAWSPDGRWLFAALNGRIVVINATTGQVASLGVRLPPVSQLAIWPGG